MSRLRDLITKHVDENLLVLDTDTKTFTYSLDASVLCEDNVSHRLQSMSLLVLHTYGLQKKHITLARTFTVTLKSEKSTVYGLFVNNTPGKARFVFVLQVVCVKDEFGKYGLTTKLVRPDQCPPELSTQFAFEVPPVNATVFVQKTGDSFVETATTAKRLLRNANSRTFRYDMPVVCSKDDIAARQLVAINNLFAAYPDRVVQQYVTVPANPATHVWWSWSPKTWQGRQGQTKPVFLTFTHLITRLPSPPKTNATFFMYCFDECESLKPVTCPTFLLNKTQPKAVFWRNIVNTRTTHPPYTEHELLDVNELRAKP